MIVLILHYYYTSWVITKLCLVKSRSETGSRLADAGRQWQPMLSYKIIIRRRCKCCRKCPITLTSIMNAAQYGIISVIMCNAFITSLWRVGHLHKTSLTSITTYVNSLKITLTSTVMNESVIKNKKDISQRVFSCYMSLSIFCSYSSSFTMKRRQPTFFFAII